MDVTVVKATGKGGHGIEEVEVENGMSQEKEMNYAASETVVGVEVFMAEFGDDLDWGEW